MAVAVKPKVSGTAEIYREIFLRSIDGIAIIDADGYYVEQNGAHEALTGYSDSDLKGNTPAIHLGEEAFAEVANALQRTGWYRGVLESRPKSGGNKKIELAAFPVLDKNGEPVYFVGIKRDITEHERLAAERDARLRELESLYALTRELNKAHEPKEIYDAAIEALISAVGADRASVLVFDSDDRMHFKAWRGLSDEYRQAVDGHSPWKREERNATSIAVDDVLTDPSTAMYAPVFAKEGIRSLAFIPIVSDTQLLGKFMVYFNQLHSFTTDEVRMGEALATQIAVVIQRRQAEEALRRSEKLTAAGKLAASVAHEINNPLEGITNLAYLLRHQVEGNPVAERYLEDLENELKRVSLITRRTLAFYRDTRPHGAVDLGELIDETVQIFRPKLQKASIQVEFKSKGKPIVMGSAGELRQVVLNLLSNAVEAIGTSGRVDIEIVENGKEVSLTVSDDGPGIEPAKVQLIFEPFFTTKTETGTGLGLPLSREIVERHGGSLVARNGENGGAEMRITLPKLEQ